MKLTPERVDGIIRDCLFKDEELKDGKPIDPYMVGEGIVAKFAFHTERLENHRNEVIELLRELPDDFRKDGESQGWSFLNMCNTKDGELWTGSHPIMEALLCLALALGVGEYCLPREAWPVLPGGVPYVAFKV